MSYLFDTDAISELFKPRPAQRYLRWLSAVPTAQQFTSAVVIGELFAGAFSARSAPKHVRNIRERVLTVVTVLVYDIQVAEAYGQIRAALQAAGLPVADADIQIGATAIVHGLEVVTGNLRHFERMPGVKIEPILADSRA